MLSKNACTCSLRSDGEYKNERENREKSKWKQKMRNLKKLRKGGGKGKWKKGKNSKRSKQRNGRKRPRTFNKKQRSRGKIEGASCPDMTRLSKSEKLSVFGWTLTRSSESKTVERMANLLFVEKCRRAFKCFYAVFGSLSVCYEQSFKRTT